MSIVPGGVSSLVKTGLTRHHDLASRSNSGKVGSTSVRLIYDVIARQRAQSVGIGYLNTRYSMSK